MDKITSITEAFSHEPITKRLANPNKDKYYDTDIKEIKLEVLNPDCNVYVGYNFEGKKLFQYIATSVNVDYI